MNEFIKCIGVIVIGICMIVAATSDPASVYLTLPIFGAYTIFVSRR